MKPQTELLKRKGSLALPCICTYIVIFVQINRDWWCGRVLPRSLLGFRHCLKETSLLPDKNVNRLLVINLSVVRIDCSFKRDVTGGTPATQVGQDWFPGNCQR